MSSINPRHKPIKFCRYQEIHDSYIESFVQRGFIGENTLRFEPDLYEIILLGEIACRGQIVITVNKSIEIIEGSGENALIQTWLYEYNVSIRNYGNVFRYDNSHSRLGHLDNHHKHEFDWRIKETGEGKVTWIGEDQWPTLGDVIEEAEKWYWNNYIELPEGYPQLGLR